MDQAKPGQRVGDYEFLDRLAVGGMGTLWRVRHVKLGSVYVAKQLRVEYREDPEFLKRFLHEARLVANLRHPNIVQVFGYDEEHTLYLMEYVKGVDLDHLLRSKRVLDLAEKRLIAEAVADTIGYAHREVDLIHRDIKPSNVLIEISSLDEPILRSKIKLTDFGIARLLSVNQRVTMSTGMVMGTLHYMAPEQFEGKADKRSDVYSIGVLYYQLLTGGVPFDGPTAFVIRDKHVTEVPPAPREVEPQVPIADSAVVMKCLEKDPARRFQDAAELSEELVASKPTTSTIPMTQLRPTPTPRRPGTEPTQRLDREQTTAPKAAETDKTLMAPAGPSPDTGAPTGAGWETLAPAQPPGHPLTEATILTPEAKQTEATLQVPKRRSRVSRLVRGLLYALVAAAVLALVATSLLKPKYELRWHTLRSDPLDTPQGIRVAVCPRIGLGLLWWGVGTVGDQAPPNWANWTTWFSSVDVKLSDGLYREYVIRCRQAECKEEEGRWHLDFGGLGFEQLAAARGAEIAEDLSGAGAYVDAVLVPTKVATAHTLGDVRRCLDRVAGLVERASGVELDRTRFEAYRGAATSLAEAVAALADGRCRDAEASFHRGEASIKQIERATPAAELPEDFLFRQTVGNAVADLKARADRADRFVKGLEPLTDSATSVRYTLSKYRAAGTAVEQYLLAVPGSPRWATALTQVAKGGGPADGAPPPVQAVARYLDRLDALVDHRPGRGQRRLFHIDVLKLFDGAAGERAQAEPAAWWATCLERQDPSVQAKVRAFWHQVHRTRFDKASTLCAELARKSLAEAAGVGASVQRREQMLALFEDAAAYLEAIRGTTHASEEAKHTAASLLSTCCVRRAVGLFLLGPAEPSQEEQHLAQVRKLLDQGLDELPACAPEAEKEGRMLRRVLKVAGAARSSLLACRRENFAKRDAYGGSVRRLFDALEAYRRLTSEMGDDAEHPCARAAMEPFARLDAEACRGFTLAHAAACWLLGRATQSCEQGRYAEALDFLRRFHTVPGQQEGGAVSPLKPLLAEAITSRAAALTKIAEAFDESAVPAQGLSAKQRSGKLWDRRLEAEPLLTVEIPATVAAEAMPAQAKGREREWVAIYGLMRTLHAHYRDSMTAERALRGVEAQAEKLLDRTGGTVRANPAAATPEAIQRCWQAVHGLKSAGRYAQGSDQAARVAALERDLAAIRTTLTDRSERIRELLAKPDPKAALDEVAAARAVLGKAAERDLTRQGVSAWVKAAIGHIDAAEFDAALAALAAVRQHEQVRRHADDPAVKAAVADVAKAVAYCEGRRSLALGPKGFGAALGKLQQAGAYRDATTLTKQLRPLEEAIRLRDKAPFDAWARVSKLLKAEKLDPKVREAATRSASETHTALVAGASACVERFQAALVQGGWETCLDRGATPQEQFDRLSTFLDRVEGLKVEQAKGDDQGEIVADAKEVRLKRKRLLSFTYKLPGTARLPVAMEQRIEWTLRYVPAEDGGAPRWAIAAWEEAY